MLSKWQGLNMQDVYSDWAEALGHLTIGAINYGITESKANKHPPSQGEFIINCRDYCNPIIPDSHMITKKTKPLTKDEAKSRLKELKRMMSESRVH